MHHNEPFCNIDLCAYPYDGQKNQDPNVRKWVNSEKTSVKRGKDINFSKFIDMAKKRARTRTTDGLLFPVIIGLPFMVVDPN